MENFELHSKWRYRVFHDLFVELAIERFVEAENAYIELNQQENEHPDGRTYELVAIIRKGCIETICFSVMALESFINTFSASYISDSFAETIDHLDVPARILRAATTRKVPSRPSAMPSTKRTAGRRCWSWPPVPARPEQSLPCAMCCYSTAG